MSNNTKLYIDPKFEADSIISALEHHPMLEQFTVDNPVYVNSPKRRKALSIKPKIQTLVLTHPTSYPTYVTVEVQVKGGNNRSINFHMNYNSEYGMKHLLSLDQGQEAIQIFKYLQDIFGGILVLDESKDTTSAAAGYLHNHDGLAYFFHTAAVEGCINKSMSMGEQLTNLKAYIDEWETKHGRNK